MHYVLTGGAGFIGSHAVHRLLNEGHTVTVIDISRPNFERRLQDVADKITFIEGDCSEPAVTDKVKPADYILHFAALPSVPESFEKPIITNKKNIDSTVNMLELARKHKAKRFVLSSTSAVYGSRPETKKIESKPVDIQSPYALSKYASELYCGIYNQHFSVPVVCLRYFNVFGPGQDPHSAYAAVIPRFITQLFTGKQPTIYGDGEQTRDFVYVQDIVSANLLACTTDTAIGKTMNVCTQKGISVRDLYTQIAELIPDALPPQFLPARTGDVKHSIGSALLAKQYLGFKAQTSLKQGLRETVEWYKNHPEWY